MHTRTHIAFMFSKSYLCHIAVGIESVCTISTIECIDEFLLFHHALRHYQPKLSLFVLCTTALEVQAREFWASKKDTRLNLEGNNTFFFSFLDKYGAINRKRMEITPGRIYRTQHEDFMMEKATAMSLALKHHANTLWLDSDVVLLDPLPHYDAEMNSDKKVIGLSPHSIRTEDEILFGKYNGGWVFTNDSDLPSRWRTYTHNSRYYDQAALENFASECSKGVEPPLLWTAPLECNFGYWRLFQSSDPMKTIKKFSLQTTTNGKLSTTTAKSVTKILYSGKPIQSVHTHFCMPQCCPPTATVFNRILLRWMERCGGYYDYLSSFLNELGNRKIMSTQS